MRRFPFISDTRGFTLLEIAIVMVIIGILTGGGVSMMRILTERKARNETADYLQQVRSALISFAVTQGRLPSADSDGDGLENSGQGAGNLPYLTLQVPPTDAYKRVLRYEVNTNLDTTSLATTCSALRGGLAVSPSVVDGDGTGTPFHVAAVLVSGGPMNADGNGTALDAYNSGTHQGNNASGNPNYLRHPPVQTFDDLTAYIGGNELFGLMCEYVNLAVNNNSGATVYVYDPDRLADLFSVAGTSEVRPILSGTRIELRSASGGGGGRLSTTPPTPMALAGRGATVTIP
jgi:prepilin-type N-terminal cleavage/methylation domain-containing protein